MIVIWSKNNCSVCTKTKTYLKMQGMKYEERNIEGGEWSMSDMREVAPNARSFPQIFQGTQHIGGFEELEAHLNMGNLRL